MCTGDTEFYIPPHIQIVRFLWGSCCSCLGTQKSHLTLPVSLIGGITPYSLSEYCWTPGDIPFWSNTILLYTDLWYKEFDRILIQLIRSYEDRMKIIYWNWESTDFSTKRMENFKSTVCLFSFCWFNFNRFESVDSIWGTTINMG